MKMFYEGAAMAVALLLGCALNDANAQAVKPAADGQEPAIHRMQIFNGPVRTLHYFSSGTTRAERIVLHDLERAENELALSDQLQALRRQYVVDERAVEARRRAAQELLAGYTPVNGTATVPLVQNGYFGSNGFPFLTGLNTPIIPASVTFYSNGLLASGGYGYPAAPFVPGYSGIGNVAEATPAVPSAGALKTDMAWALAAQSTPEFAAQATRNLTVALARAGDSDRLRAGLDLRKNDSTIFAGYESPTVKSSAQGAHVTVSMKNGKKIEGTLVSEDADSVVVSSGNDEIEIRKNETVSIAKRRLSGPGKP